MNIKDILKKDHREALDLCEKICQQKFEGSELTSQFNKLYEAVIAHAHAEQKVLYQFLKNSKKEELREFSLEGEVEHTIVEDLLGLLKRSRKKGGEQWMARCKVVKELLEHHIEEEEGELFEMMDKEISKEEMETLGKEMLEKEEQEKKMAA